MGNLGLVATLEQMKAEACAVRDQTAEESTFEKLEEMIRVFDRKIEAERTWSARMLPGSANYDDGPEPAGEECGAGLEEFTPFLTAGDIRGRRDYRGIAARIGATVSAKQAAYGDSYGKSGRILRLLYPDSIAPEQYDDMLGLVRVIDKCFRIATDRDALGENPWDDIAGYGILGAGRTAAC